MGANTDRTLFTAAAGTPQGPDSPKRSYYLFTSAGPEISPNVFLLSAVVRTSGATGRKCHG